MNHTSGSRFSTIRQTSAAREGFPFRVITSTPPQFSTMEKRISSSHAGFPQP